jgi:hypothetical protein
MTVFFERVFFETCGFLLGKSKKTDLTGAPPPKLSSLKLLIKIVNIRSNWAGDSSFKVTLRRIAFIVA